VADRPPGTEKDGLKGKKHLSITFQISWDLSSIFVNSATGGCAGT
jgi:hypothetical protein